jgi:hypothetical protein
MKNVLESSLIRTLKVDGSPVGMGYLVTDRFAISYAHVVVAAPGLLNIPKTAPVAGIQLDYPLPGPGQTGYAHVVAWNASREKCPGSLVGLTA